MQIFYNYTKEVSRLIQLELATPGLLPQWSSPEARGHVPADALALIAPLIANPAPLMQTPARDWIPELLEAWRRGLVYLRDEKSTVHASVLVRARRLIVRASYVGPFSLIGLEDVLIRDSSFASHCTVDGPVVIIDSHFRQNVILGPYVIITSSSAEPFVKVSRCARVDKSLLASNSSIEGSTHPEQIPLGPTKRRLGVGIGPHAWIGQHVSVTHGGVVGRGVVVATHTAITRRTSDFVFVSGSPPREFPIDFNIRGLSPEESFHEGWKQGMMAVHLPAFGPLQSAFATPTRLELDYAEHVCLRGLASENLLHFQRGVLALAMAQLFPEHEAEVSFAVGKTVRFTVAIDRPLADALYGPGPFARELFRGGGDAGMFLANAPASYLAKMWGSLVTAKAPLPPHDPTRAQPVAPAARHPTAPDPLLAAPGPPATSTPTTSTEDVESIIAAMVARLTHRAAPIDPDAPFHALGVDSIAAAELAVSVEARFNLTAPDVFRHNSVRKLAQLIRDSL